MKTSNLSKRNCIRIISFTAVLVIVAGISLITLYTERNSYRMQVEYAYELALEDLTASLEDIDTELKKGVYCTSAAGWSEIASNLSAAAGTAKSSLSSLPFSGPADRDTQNLRLLSQTAASLYSAVSDVRYGISSFTDSGIEAADSAVEELSAALIDTDEAITDYPTLVYDGPFSDHLLNAAPKHRNHQRGRAAGCRPLSRGEHGRHSGRRGGGKRHAELLLCGRQQLDLYYQAGRLLLLFSQIQGDRRPAENL